MNKLREQGKRPDSGLLRVLLTKAKLTEDRLDAALTDAGLSCAKQWALIHLVQADTPLPLWQLAERIGCVKSNVTQLVDRLESEGLVRRVADPEDRRGIRAEITVEGRRRHSAGIAAEESVESEILGGFTLDEREQLKRLLGRLGNHPA